MNEAQGDRPILTSQLHAAMWGCMSVISVLGGWDRRIDTRLSWAPKKKVPDQAGLPSNLISYKQMIKQTKHMRKSRGAESTTGERQVSLRDYRGMWQCSPWLSLSQAMFKSVLFILTTLDGSKCEFKVGWSRKKRCERRGHILHKSLWHSCRSHGEEYAEAS